LRVLLLVNGALGEQLAAPEIRGWEMARVLASRHHVTISASHPSEVREGIRIVPSNRTTLVREARGCDVVVAPRMPAYLFGALAGHDAPLVVADLYNPFDAERSELLGSSTDRRDLATAHVGHRLQLRFADVILSAVEAQRRRLIEQLRELPPRPGRQPALEVVRFGISDDPPPSDRRPLREQFPAIRPDDIVILWWGNIWRWFDADLAIRAVAHIAQSRPDVRLVVTAGRSPRGDSPHLTATDAARALAVELGVLDKNVFFLDEWVAQKDRHDYLEEADIGLTLARDTPETTVAARGRYMDYLWAALPCVLGAGDELSERFSEAGFALTVPPADLNSAIACLEALISDPDARRRASKAGRALSAEFRWSVTVQPLLDRIDQLEGEEPALAHPWPLLAGELGEYYARRAWHKASLTVAQRAGGR